MGRSNIAKYNRDWLSKSSGSMSFRSITLAILLLWANAVVAQTNLATPILSTPSASGDIAAFRLQNTSTSVDMTAGWVTIGHIFAPGQLAAGHGIQLRVCSGGNCSGG